ncbi:hypothetical protein CXF97_00750 [Pseudomonas sp. Choline-02u-1]|jgi:hypothetical protein|uniref:hypothetical protein n=1 Tax=unclassified Pseudomonas TaxID=196821 RepID=UPI000C33A87F|nr:MULTISPECIES: hypothetical protein [unclassified Pseudomonas]PKH84952.1 hypothetical protein CXF97_00750 [Pseudomonas sp. Choline-02u-1]
MRKTFKSLLLSTVLMAASLVAVSSAQATTAPIKEAATHNTMMLTVFLKHDQSRPLGELKAQLAQQGFYKTFPPAGVEVVSWNIMMGIGQVVTVRFPASRLAEVNLALENTAWGTYRTEFYPTYDFKPIALAEQSKAQAAQ